MATAVNAAARPRFIARWDLDKTYLRTDFDTLVDLVRTAIERPDQKRTVPGAAALLRELGRAGVETHILSGSPEQLRSRIVEKLRLDGVKWASLTLKPNLRNMLLLRFRALRGQLGYKLPALLLRRAELEPQVDRDGVLVKEVLLGDDAEADAFVYSLYADLCAGAVKAEDLPRLLEKGGAYKDAIRESERYLSYIQRGDAVERILIHLERQSAPSDFRVYGKRVVPFYNYLQAAFILHEDGRIPARAVLNVATELTVAYNFDPTALARSFADLARRGHVTGRGIPELEQAFSEELAAKRLTAASDLSAMIEQLGDLSIPPPSVPPGAPRPPPEVDYEQLVEHHNPRRAKRR